MLQMLCYIKADVFYLTSFFWPYICSALFAHLKVLISRPCLHQALHVFQDHVNAKEPFVIRGVRSKQFAGVEEAPGAPAFDLHFR